MEAERCLAPRLLTISYKGQAPKLPRKKSKTPYETASQVKINVFSSAKNPSQTSVDGLSGPDEAMQVTCAKTHPVKAQGLFDAFEGMRPHSMSKTSKQDCHLIFLVPSDMYSSYKKQSIHKGTVTDEQLKTCRKRVVQWVVGVNFTQTNADGSNGVKQQNNGSSRHKTAVRKTVKGKSKLAVNKKQMKR